MDPNTAPLHGVHVLDFTNFMSGPYCTRMLAELGATVLKIEAPSGDQNRQRAPLRPHGESAYFGQLNAGKHSLVLDLKTESGRAAAHRLVASADVLIQNFRPGVMERLDLGYPRCRELNPRLVYCAISGFGQSGPRAHQPAYAQIIHAESGFDAANLSYQPVRGAPATAGVFVADVLGGMTAFGGILTALFARTHTGEGQLVDVSLYTAMLSMLIWETQLAQHDAPHNGLAYRPSRTSDGHIMVTPISEKNLRDTLAAIGRPELLEDPRFKEVGEREQNWDQLADLIEEWTSRYTSAEAVELLAAGGVPCATYKTVADMIDGQDATLMSAMRTVRDAQGTYMAAGVPFTLSEFAYSDVTEVPVLGSGTRRWLADLAGMGEHQIDQVIGTEGRKDVEHE